MTLQLQKNPELSKSGSAFEAKIEWGLRITAEDINNMTWVEAVCEETLMWVLQSIKGFTVWNLSRQSQIYEAKKQWIKDMLKKIQTNDPDVSYEIQQLFMYADELNAHNNSTMYDEETWEAMNKDADAREAIHAKYANIEAANLAMRAF